MGVVGVIVRVEHANERPDAQRQKLLANVGASVDENGRRPACAELLNERSTAQAPVLRVLRIAPAPVVADTRHAPGGAAAKDREPVFHAGDAMAVRGTFLNSRKKFSVVAVSSS